MKTIPGLKSRLENRPAPARATWRHGRLGLLLALAVASATGRAAVVAVNDGDDLQAKIDAASGGDVVQLGTGTYAGFKLSDRHFTAEKPLVIRAAPGAKPLILGHNYEGYLGKIANCSYLVFDGLTMANSNQPFYCVGIDHVIFANLEIHNTGQEVIHVRGASSYIDVLRCRLYDTGHAKPQWCEGVYIGVGNPPFESVEHVWIEGNEIYRTGNAEAINIKSRAYHVTIRGNKVHDLAPGTATQYNCAGISLEAADLSFRPGEDTDIWIEDNEIYDVRYGRWANGIQSSTMGPRIVRNHIHDCAQYGIEYSDYLNGPGSFPSRVFGNVIERCAAGATNTTAMTVLTTDPGPNPNRPQTWYRP